MQLSSLLLPAALAWSSATALLVPPETSGDALAAMVAGSPAQKPFDVRLDCYGCAVAQDKQEDGSRAWDEAGNKKTQIGFTLSQHDDALFLGETKVYPPSPETLKAALFGKQLKSGDDSAADFDVTADDLLLATRMDIRNRVPLQQDGHTMSEVAIEVLGLEGRVVHVGTVTFMVIDRPGQGTVAMSEPHVVATVTTPEDASCTTILCRAKAQMKAKLQALKGAMGKAKAGCMKMMGMRPGHQHMPAHGQHQHQHEGENMNVVDRLKGGPNKFAGKFGGPHGKKPCPGRHGFVGRLAHGLAAFTRHVIMPVLIGVAAGMAVSAMGMAIGQLVFMVYMRLRGPRNGGYIVVYDTENSADDADFEPLPVYAAGEHVLPPAYDEKKDGQN